MLTRQKGEAERAKAAYEIESNKRIAALEERIASLSAGKGDSNSAGEKSAASSSSNTPDIEAMIQRAVTKAIEGDRAESSRTILQQRAFDTAARDLPELRDGKSEAFQMFEQIWDSNPEFQKMPSGPLFVAATVKDLLSKSKGTSSANKQHASSPQPHGGRDRLEAPLSSSQADELVSKVVKQAQTAELGDFELGALIAGKNAQFDARRNEG